MIEWGEMWGKNTILFFGLLSLAVFSLGAPQSSGRFSVDAETIVVNVLVTDRNGKPLLGLQKENFQVFEDGVEQEIQNFFPVDAPFSVGLLLDTSFSTVGKLARIQDSAIEFLDQIHPDDEVMVISFDDEVYLGIQELREQPHRKVMVLFTDGVDMISPTTSAGETVDLAKEAEVTIYTIFFNTKADALGRLRNPGLGGPGPSGPTPSSPLPFPLPLPTPRRDPRDSDSRFPDEEAREQVERMYLQAQYYLSQLAEVTGGARFDAAGNLSDLEEAFSKIAEEMRSLYTIGYVPSNSEEDGEFREIQVRVNLEEGRVRTRQGYYSRRSH